MRTTHDPAECIDCKMQLQDWAEAREATANRIFSVADHLRERRYAANLAAQWQG